MWILVLWLMAADGSAKPMKILPAPDRAECEMARDNINNEKSWPNLPEGVRWAAECYYSNIPGSKES